MHQDIKSTTKWHIIHLVSSEQLCHCFFFLAFNGLTILTIYLHVFLCFCPSRKKGSFIRFFFTRVMVYDLRGWWTLFRLGVTAWVGVPDGEFIITFIMFSMQEFRMLQSDIADFHVFYHSLVNLPLLLEMLVSNRQVSCHAKTLEEKSATTVVIRLHHCNNHHTLRIPLWDVFLSFLFTYTMSVRGKRGLFSRYLRASYRKLYNVDTFFVLICSPNLY